MKPLVTVLIISILICGIPSLAKSAKKKNPPALIVKLELLVEKPFDYDKKNIITEGCLTTGFENVGIYFNDKDCMASEAKHGLWVSLPKNSDLLFYYPKEKTYRVKLSATMNAKNKGHMGMWQGTLERVNIITSKELK